MGALVRGAADIIGFIQAIVHAADDPYGMVGAVVVKLYVGNLLTPLEL